MKYFKRCKVINGFAILLFLFIFCVKISYNQIIESTGEIFVEVSNIISVMPGHSGNNYNEPSEPVINSWGSIMDELLTGNYLQACVTANTLGYDLIRFTDTTDATVRTYFILKNNGSNYWGTYIYNPDYCRPLVIQVTHPLKEINTGQQGIHVFHKTEALFYCLSGTSRCNHSDYTSCDGSTTICSGTSERYRISDMAHNVSTIFQKTTEVLLNSFSNTFFVQLHGFAKLATDPYLILSNGTQVMPLQDYSILLKNNLLAEDNTLTFKIAHVDLEWTRLRAFDNTQGRLINSSIDPCNENATSTNGRFLSIEQERTKLRDDVWGWNKMANALINTFVCYPFLWDGSADSDWNTAANWRENAVPTSIDNVTIANRLNNPVINEEAESPANCYNLEIQNGATLTINPGKAITVLGTLNNFGSLTIRSDASGTGSLICSTTGVEAKVERFLTKMKWHFIGMPVENGVAGVFHLPSGHADIYLKTHIESTNTWGPFIVPVTTPLTQGRGYECWVGDPSDPPNQMDETVVFPGKLGAGDYTTGSGNFYTLEYTPGHGLNLISNPYPSALQANITTWIKNNVAPKAWIWSPTSGNYVFWGSGDNYGNGNFGTMTGGIIPEMQAFFVEATGSNPSLTIPQSSRVHSSQAFYKDSEIPLNTLRFDVTGNGYEDAIFISLNEHSTIGYDTDYDIEKLYGLDEAPQLFSEITDKKLSINALPSFDENMIIPIGFECGVSSTFTLTTSGMDGFNQGVEFFLEDLKEETVQNLNENPVYSFVAEPLDEVSRFILHFTNPSAVEDNLISPVRIYGENDEIHILNLTQGQVSVHVCDLMGRLVIEKQINGENSLKVEAATSRGYYLVKVQTFDHVVTQKVFIR